MAFGHGKNARFLIDDSTGSLADISSGMTDCSLDGSADTAEVSGFSDNNKTYVMGLRGHSFSISGQFSTATDAVLNGIVGTTTGGGTFEYYPNSTASGAVKKTGECLCTAYSPKSAIGGAVNYTASFLVSGSVTTTYVA